MDLLDTVKVLRFSLPDSGSTTGVVEAEEELRWCENTVQYSKELSIADRDRIFAAIKRTTETFNLQQALQESSWGGKVPDPLFITNLFGGVDTELINHVPVFQIRGKDYMKSTKKIASDCPLFYLRGMQIVNLPSLKTHIAQHDWCPLKNKTDGHEWLVMNIMVPGSSSVHVVSYYSASREALDIIRAGRKKNSTDDSVKSGKADSSDATVDGLNHSIENLSIEGLDQGNASGKGPVSSSTEWVPLLERFWFGDDTFRNNRFKMIPIIVKGAWSIKTAVGQKPALTGTKLTQKYFLGPNYLEVDIDISSSTVANTILGMVRGVSKSMVVDVGITIQGESAEELPERVLCHARYDRVDMRSAATWSE